MVMTVDTPHGQRAYEPKTVEVSGVELETNNTWFFDRTRDLWLKHFVDNSDFVPVKSYLEIGVNCGVSFCWAATHLVELGGSATGIDPYIAPRESMQHIFDCSKAAAHANVAKFYDVDVDMQVHVAASRDWFTKVRRNAQRRRGRMQRFEMIFIDGDHSAKGALLDMIFAWEMLKVGGYLIVDDYNRRFHRGRPLVREAVRAFELTHDHSFDWFYHCQKQICFRKIQ